MKTVITVQHPKSQQHENGMIGSLGAWELTEQGILHARKIAAGLLRDGYGEDTLLISSDLTRTAQTAEIIGECLGVKPVYTPLLREFDLGEANGKTKAWAKENLHCPVWQGTRDWAKSIDGRVFAEAETKREVYARLEQFLAEYVAPQAGNLILVSHAGTLSVLFALWMGLPVEALEKVNFDGKAGGVSVLKEDDDGHRILAKLNDMQYTV